MKSNVMKVLTDKYQQTGFNFFPKLQLQRETKVTDKELHLMMKEGLIERAMGLNDTLIVLPKSTIEKIIR